jgi:hypothetical protein
MLGLTLPCMLLKPFSMSDAQQNYELSSISSQLYSANVWFDIVLHVICMV